jgi:hypothetical protein
MKENLRLEMEKWLRKESEISNFKETSSSKIEDLDQKWEKMLEKYKKTKAENKTMK